MSTPSLPTNTVWFTNATSAANATTRGALAARGTSLAGQAAAFASSGNDDAFGRALERSREAARAESARNAQRELQREPESPKPEAAHAAQPDTAASNARRAAPDRPDHASQPEPGDRIGEAGASTGSEGTRANAAERQRRAASAAAGKPYPGNDPAHAEVKEPVICLVPEDSDEASRADTADAAAGGGQATEPALTAATLAAAATAAAAAARNPAAGADASAAERSASDAAAADAPIAANGRSAAADARQRLARASAAGVRDDLGPVGGPTLAPWDPASAQRDTLQHALPAGTPGGAHAALAAGATGTSSASDGTAGAASRAIEAADARSAAAPAGAPATDASAQRTDLRSSEVFALPTKAPPGNAPEAMLWARPGSPDFVPQLGAQLAVWVRDGVHEARLQLNPADMGPVRVDIQLDGSAAQVSLTAANDDTRQALQDALPGLAGSLRDAGFTLAGGGVFDQAPQQRDAGSRQTGNSRPAVLGGLDTASAATSAEALPARRRGLVDLVA